MRTLILIPILLVACSGGNPSVTDTANACFETWEQVNAAAEPARCAFYARCDPDPLPVEECLEKGLGKTAWSGSSCDGCLVRACIQDWESGDCDAPFTPECERFNQGGQCEDPLCHEGDEDCP